MLLSTWGLDFLFQLSSENNADVYIDILIKSFMVLILAGTVQSAGSRKGVISSYPVLLRFDFFFLNTACLIKLMCHAVCISRTFQLSLVPPVRRMAATLAIIVAAAILWLLAGECDGSFFLILHDLDLCVHGIDLLYFNG